MPIDIDLDRYVSIPDWELDDDDTWLNVSGIPISNVIKSDSQLSKRRDIDEVVTWLLGAGYCIENTTDLKVAVWGIGYNIWLHLHNHDCSVETGKTGPMYWKYWANGGDCSTTADQKTIAGAIMGMIRKLEGNWLCNNYCISMSHGGTWHGTLIVGPSQKAWGSSCAGVYKGDWDMGCGSLEWPYSCSSQGA